MTSLHLYLAPLWLLGLAASLLVILLTLMALRESRRLLARDPENALWLLLNWLALVFAIFGFIHLISIGLQDLTAYWDYANLDAARRIFNGFDSILFVAAATLISFFYRLQRLYRRLEADHHHLEQTSQEILALNREMESLVMERTMSEMALGMAHGIRNPLQVIGGFSQRLLKKTDAADPSRVWASAISEEAKRIEHMVERFETLARRKTSFFTQEDLNLIVQETLDLLRPELRAKNLNLVREFCREPLVGRLNKHLLKVALAHLLRNAMEATRPGGTIMVHSSTEKNFAVLVIQDTGRGMPGEVVDKVFVPFYTTKLGGTGLGMVFVRQIVDEHRGTITLNSRVGEGTTVTIRLPRRFADHPEVTGEE
ncbi:MAG: ATP-binding protein [Desulfobaccales bacterium]|jgi:signal transduction histidine kinase